MDQTATRTRRSLARTTAALVLAVVTALVSLAVAAPANAYQYASGGYVGGVSWARGECRDKPAWGQLQVIAKAPVVSSPNVHAGYGNDLFWVRYRAYLVDARTGATLQTSGYSQWIQANDNRSATWSGQTAFAAARLGNYVVDYRVEWWNSTSQIGWRAERVNSWNFIDGVQTGPYGPFSSCALIY